MSSPRFVTIQVTMAFDVTIPEGKRVEDFLEELDYEFSCPDFEISDIHWTGEYDIPYDSDPQENNDE